MKKQSWKKELSESISDLKNLSRYLKLSSNLLEDLEKPAKMFGLRSTKSFLDRIETDIEKNPLAKQILPSKKELIIKNGYKEDPLAEEKKSPALGVIHKYKSRALLIAAGTCAINCRYCFRRHYSYSDNTPSLSAWGAAIKYIEKDTTIKEVILSGGDPLMVKDSKLKCLIKSIENIKHVISLRIHTRLPVVLPKRITRDLAEILNKTRLKSVVVLHVNSPYEINDEVVSALSILRKTMILNQSVLLRDINDDEQELISLSYRLSVSSVVPYYVHLLDKVKGVSHFEVEKCIGEGLMYAISKKLPGYLVPRLAKEIPYLDSKFIIC